jgi:hypothetical protein
MLTHTKFVQIKLGWVRLEHVEKDVDHMRPAYAHILYAEASTHSNLIPMVINWIIFMLG